jgi:hypothetical protein
MRIAYYHADIPTFITADNLAVLGELARAHGFALEPQQRDAWLTQIAILKQAVRHLQDGYILFEFAIPRMGKRADVVLLIGGVILVLEFKVGANAFNHSALVQAHDYALDLKNFHRGSHTRQIIPTVVATKAPSQGDPHLQWAADMVATPIQASADAVKRIIDACVSVNAREPFDLDAWLASGYQPTPTIVEAAQALYQRHGVEEIARSDAGARNLGATTDCIAAIIEHSKTNERKSICFVTGVPGAGKTLAGLNIATKRAQEHSDEHAVFLSGNGPLVTVLREALARDEAAREGTSKQAAARKVASFIQNVHHFRDDALRNTRPPDERVVIFDEAQRAWTLEQTAKFMQTKRGQADFAMSEPEFLISVMDRHADWCVVICLVGGGQEINTGEAGLGEWFHALRTRFTNWDVYVSDRLNDPDYIDNGASNDALKGLRVSEKPDLHLAVSMRSFRAETLSAFVGHVVENRAAEARRVYAEIAERYPIWLTRDLRQARAWLRAKARGSERFGLLASSGGYRLRPEGLHVKAKIDAPVWFLNDRSDVRSAFYCEDVATEFDVQGLELDWAGVCWDGDFRYCNGEWALHRFRGTRWEQVNAPESRLYLKNAYRVILTRARQGMIIFVPCGASDDPTRTSAFYDPTFEFLQSCGLGELESVASPL